MLPKIGEALECGPVTRRVRELLWRVRRRLCWAALAVDPKTPTLRQDRWWVQPVVTVSILTAFIIYSTWAAFQNRYYFVGASMHRDLISPFYSPCIGGVCVPGAKAGFTLNWFRLSPALLILIFPLGLSPDVLLLPTQLLPRVLVVAAGLRRRRRARQVHR